MINQDLGFSFHIKYPLSTVQVIQYLSIRLPQLFVLYLIIIVPV